MLQRRKSQEGLLASEEQAKGEECLATSLTLWTSFGRAVDFGAKAARGEAFAFTATEGEEVEDVRFGEKQCIGIRTTPMLVSWPRDRVEEVKQAFKVAAEQVWSLLLRLSFLVGPRHGKFALLEAKRMGIRDLKVPPGMQSTDLGQCYKAKPPVDWDLSAMRGSSAGLGPDTGVGLVELEDLQLSVLQGALTASFARPVAAPSTCGTKEDGERTPITLAPQGVELIRAFRLQNWQAWCRFVARREEIRAHMAELRAAGHLKPLELGGHAAGMEEPCLAAALSGLGITLDGETNCTWLFHGITDKAADITNTPDFDIAKAGAEDGRLYGRGCYLSEWSSKIDKLFIPDSNDGLRCMLLCRVALGNVLGDGELLPDRLHLVEQCLSGPYHSVLGDRRGRSPGSTRDFVVFDKDQVYPEFLLWYRRLYR